MFADSKLTNNQSALKDKYEMAERALQEKWNKYCSRGKCFIAISEYRFVFLLSCCCCCCCCY